MRTVAVVEDDPALLLGLSEKLGMEGFKVVSARDGEAALELLGSVVPDVLVLDLMLPKVDGFEVCREMVDALSDVRVLFLTSYDDASSVRAARAAGAHGLLSKETTVEGIVAAILAAVSDAGRRAFPAAGQGVLTDRELDVLERMARGLTQPEIAADLGVSPETVKSYARELYSKLGAHDRAGALNEARRLGLLAAPPGSGVPRDTG